MGYNGTTGMRRHLLETGARMYLANPNPDFRWFRVTVLLRKAHASPGAFYSNWSSKDKDPKKAFIDDLVRFLVGDSDLFAKEDEAINRVAAGTVGLPALTALGKVATADIGTLLGHDVWRAMEALIVTYVSDRPDLHKVAEGGYQQVDQVTWDWYAVVLKRAGRHARRPMTPQGVGKILQALVEGAGIRQIFDPAAFTRPIGPNSTDGSYAVAVQALLSVLTAGPGDARTVFDVLRELTPETT